MGSRQDELVTGGALACEVVAHEMGHGLRMAVGTMHLAIGIHGLEGQCRVLVEQVGRFQVLLVLLAADVRQGGRAHFLLDQAENPARTDGLQLFGIPLQDELGACLVAIALK